MAVLKIAQKHLCSIRGFPNQLKVLDILPNLLFFFSLTLRTYMTGTSPYDIFRRKESIFLRTI